MKNIVLHTTGSYAPLVLRLLLSIVFFPHGAQKLLGWFGGYGFEGTMGYFTGQVGLPWIVAFLVIIVEFFGPIFLLLGLATRIWSLAMIGLFTGIVATTVNDYFFMNWDGTQPAEGYEFFVLAIGMALALLITGGGAYSVDAVISGTKTDLLSETQQPVNVVKKIKHTDSAF